VKKQRLYGNFYTYEVARSQIATRNKIDNTPNELELKFAKCIAKEIFQPCRDHFGIPYSPSSWFRCEALEKVICKSAFEDWCIDNKNPIDELSWIEYFSKKQHPTGGACDIEIPGISNDDLFEFIKRNLEFDQLIREFAIADDPHSGWVHGSWTMFDRRKQAFKLY